MQIKEKFPLVLKKNLVARYGYLPSCAMFANHFNLKSSSHKTITRETARRWLNGESFPQLDNFYTLTNWLKFNEDDFNIIFDLNPSTQKIDNEDFIYLSETYKYLFDSHKEILIIIARALRQKQDAVFLKNNTKL